jgi:hypothetical protein
LVTGSFGAVTPQTLQVVGNNSQQMDFTPAQVQRVDRVVKRSSMWAAAPLVGAAAGFGAGFGIGWGAAAQENSKHPFELYSRSRCGILGAVLGAPVGALIGYKVRGPGHSVIYRAK